MDGFFSAFYKGFQWFTGLGGSGILAVMLLVLGLVMGLGFIKSLRASLSATLGFIGLNLVVNNLLGYIRPTILGLAENLGWSRNIVDTGSMIAQAWAAPMSAFVIVLAIALNIILILTKVVKTLHIDFWNFWHFCGSGAIIYAATKNLGLVLLGTGLYMLVVWKVADWLAPKQQELYGIEGCSWPTGACIPAAIIGVPIIRLCQKIPGLKDVNANPDTIQKRFGIFGETVVFGFVLGILLGILGGQPVAQILLMGFNLSATMVLVPKMIGIMMEGLMPIAEAGREFSQKFLKGRDVWIGIDASTILGHSSTLAVAMLMMPLAVIISGLMPGSGVIFAASLTGLPWMVAPLTAEAKGNVVHMLIASCVVISIYALCSTWISPYFTEMYIMNGNAAEGLVTSMSETGNFMNTIYLMVLKALGLVAV